MQTSSQTISLVKSVKKKKPNKQTNKKTTEMNNQVSKQSKTNKQKTATIKLNELRGRGSKSKSYCSNLLSRRKKEKENKEKGVTKTICERHTEQAELM